MNMTFPITFKVITNIIQLKNTLFIKISCFRQLYTSHFFQMMHQEDDSETESSTADTSDAANEEKDAIVKCGDLANLAFFEDVFSSSHDNRDLKLNKTAASDIAVKILLLKILHSRFTTTRFQHNNENFYPKAACGI
jgi:hypothetical protein